MAFNRFLYLEIVDISDGNTARVKNYYPSNNFVVLFDHSKNDMANVKPGMTITGQSSNYSKTLTEWNYSTVENDMKFDRNHNTYEYQDYEDKLVADADNGLIVTDAIYNSYPHNNPGGDYAKVNIEILDFQRNEGIIQDNY